MNNFNSTILEGSLTANPIKDNKRTLFRILCTRKDVASVFDVTTYNGLADTCLKYLKKGSRVIVSGALLAGGEVECKEVNIMSPVGVPQ